MELIPVLDLKDGLVVRAQFGERQNYLPTRTPLSPTSNPVEVMRGLLRIHAFQTFYVADLNAIENHGDNRAVVAQLKAQCGVNLWVDNGIAELEAARGWLDDGLGELVIGSETQRDPALLAAVARDARRVLSLDFRADIPKGPPALLEEVGLWPQRVIVMSLGRVGSGAGPDLDAVHRVQSAGGAGRKV